MQLKQILFEYEYKLLFPATATTCWHLQFEFIVCLAVVIIYKREFTIELGVTPSILLLFMYVPFQPGPFIIIIVARKGRRLNFEYVIVFSANSSV